MSTEKGLWKSPKLGCTLVAGQPQHTHTQIPMDYTQSSRERELEKRCLQAAISNLCAAKILNHAIPDYLVRGTDLFSLTLSNKNDNSQHNNSCLVWMHQNYTCFFGKISKKCNTLFGVPQNFSNEFMCAMRWKRLKIAAWMQCLLHHLFTSLAWIKSAVPLTSQTLSGVTVCS